MHIITPLPGVFTPRSDTWLLAEVVRQQDALPGAEVLELGTGSGAIGVSAAKGGARRVTVVDVSRRALVTASLNARLNGVRVVARRGDLFAPVQDERFDIVVSNPPYLPSQRIPTRGASRAWEGGGPDGRSILARICAEVPRHLNPGGSVLLVHSSINGVQRTLDALEDGGLQAAVIARERGSVGPLLAERRPDLDEEEIYVVRGRLQ
ncbi:MAG: Peptide chain release factor N(5)-glutamine methyltransferase [uncultured Solirubrobacteraceae bacterium]|uniref:Peptide chain release factor N(5)-glutamine methyltransferase n=1 Tax=uncultured Solirubrobacteraceae bacterium TaxID=1162706 RepID=A0A6J4RPL7_9ACTN|nr:MAG: Peptide chain release factor N(5)-glutamine methyltransferase [uncultured Solirubrobacteraceae bacterium]